jgi:acetyl esterase/lipase
MVDSKVQRWVPRGFVFVSIDYGLLPQTPVARQADDVAHALAFVQQHAAEWGGDGDKVLLMGHSAGAHLVALLDAAPDRARAAGARPWLGTIALDSAAYDVPAIMQRRHLPLYDTAFGKDPAQWTALSPLEQLHGAGPPLLAVCSSVRLDDPCSDARRFAARAVAFERRVEVQPQPLSHAEINATLGKPGAYTDAVEAFMKSLDPTVRRHLETTP